MFFASPSDPCITNPRTGGIPHANATVSSSSGHGGRPGRSGVARAGGRGRLDRSDRQGPDDVHRRPACQGHDPGQEQRVQLGLLDRLRAELPGERPDVLARHHVPREEQRGFGHRPGLVGRRDVALEQRDPPAGQQAVHVHDQPPLRGDQDLHLGDLDCNGQHQEVGIIGGPCERLHEREEVMPGKAAYGPPFSFFILPA